MDERTVARVAKVSRLDLTEDELRRYSADLQEILEAFAVLDEAPGAEGLGLDPVPVEDQLRDDVPLPWGDASVLRDLMRAQDDGRVRGPRVQ